MFSDSDIRSNSIPLSYACPEIILTASINTFLREKASNCGVKTFKSSILLSSKNLTWDNNKFEVD